MDVCERRHIKPKAINEHFARFKKRENTGGTRYADIEDPFSYALGAFVLFDIESTRINSTRIGRSFPRNAIKYVPIISFCALDRNRPTSC